MGQMNDELVGYDAAGDADRLSVPMKKWGSIGFLRGFAGVRSEILPKGKVNLPSTVFLQAAVAELDAGKPDENERARRESYIQTVEAQLREVQETAINDHFRKATWGQLADLAVAVLILSLTVGLFIRVGPLHPVTIVLVSLFAIKLLFMLVSVRRMIDIAQDAFKSEAHSIRIPWTQ